MKSRTLDPERLTKPIRERLDTSMLAIPKPGPREKAQPKDGRLIERGAAYSRSKRGLWEKQDRRCANVACLKRLPSPAFGHRHHLGGRGLGGGKRDDGKTVLLCPDCHQGKHPGPQWSKH